MIPIYGEILSAIEKALRELVEKYQRVRKSFRNLIEGQERNTVQLERIGAAIEWRWGSEGEVGKEESRDDTKRSEDGLRESQKERTSLSTSC